MQIHIKNLHLRTIIGVYDWERSDPQDVIVNVWLQFDAAQPAKTDEIADTLDYKGLKQRIMEEVERSSFHLLERLAARILDVAMEDAKVLEATVEVDKPHALRLADSVSVRCSKRRE
jgi:D-erythro-7,8-dihydroneopterin triphosphate epimerase